MSKSGTIAYLTGAEEIRFSEYELPSPEPEAIIADVVCANICGSDIHTWENHPASGENITFGHEGICRVVELGSKVDTDFAGEKIEEGDLVAPVYYSHCRKCHYCQEGKIHLCESAYKYFSNPPSVYPHFNSLFASHYYIHPNQHFYKVPEDIDIRILASANCALAQILFGFDQIDASFDDTIVVQGAGGLGLNAIAVANEIGAETILIEGHTDRIDLARKFSPEHIIDMNIFDSSQQRSDEVKRITHGKGADIGIEVAGVPSAFAEGIDFIKNGGCYLEMGNVTTGVTTEFDPGKLTRSSIDIVTAIRYKPWYLKKAINYLPTLVEKYPYKDLFDGHYSLKELNKALTESKNRSVGRACIME